MNETKTDLRVLRTRQNIRNAFMELIQKKPISKISVTELAKAAMINKGTFYLHYKDVYDLYFGIIKDELNQIYDDIGDYTLFFDDPERFVRNYYEAFAKRVSSHMFFSLPQSDLGLQVPTYTASEFKKRLYATGRIQESADVDMKLHCIICNLFLVGFHHYRNAPDATVRIITAVIRALFPVG